MYSVAGKNGMVLWRNYDKGHNSDRAPLTTTDGYCKAMSCDDYDSN